MHAPHPPSNWQWLHASGREEDDEEDEEDEENAINDEEKSIDKLEDASMLMIELLISTEIALEEDTIDTVDNVLLDTATDTVEEILDAVLDACELAGKSQQTPMVFAFGRHCPGLMAPPFVRQSAATVHV